MQWRAQQLQEEVDANYRQLADARQQLRTRADEQLHKLFDQLAKPIEQALDDADRALADPDPTNLLATDLAKLAGPLDELQPLVDRELSDKPQLGQRLAELAERWRRANSAVNDRWNRLREFDEKNAKLNDRLAELETRRDAAVGKKAPERELNACLARAEELQPEVEMLKKMAAELSPIERPTTDANDTANRLDAFKYSCQVGFLILFLL